MNKPTNEQIDRRVAGLDADRGWALAEERGLEVERLRAEAKVRGDLLAEYRDVTVAGYRTRTLQAEERLAKMMEALERIVGRLDHADKIGRPVDGLAVAMVHDAREALGMANFPGAAAQPEEESHG